jgi:hypothetical protein
LCRSSWICGEIHPRTFIYQPRFKCIDWLSGNPESRAIEPATMAAFVPDLVLPKTKYRCRGSGVTVCPPFRPGNKTKIPLASEMDRRAEDS